MGDWYFIFCNKIFNSFEKNEIELNRLRSIYKENSIEILNKIEKRKLLLNSLEKIVLEDINAKKTKNLIFTDSISRPTNVLTKYAELLAKAQRDETTLVNLENDLRIYELTNDEINNPWELITEPTLSEYPVAPRRTRITLLYTSIGLLFGISYSQVLLKKDHNGIMNSIDNWARVFVVIIFLTFGEAQIKGGIVPNLIAFGLFLSAIGYFAATWKMVEMFG